jgi:hypothetical protein
MESPLSTPRSTLQDVLHRHDLVAGLLFMAFAAFFVAQTFGLSGLGALFTDGLAGLIDEADLPIGTARRMGPGYFPLWLSGLLFALGVVLVVRGVRSAPAASIPPMPWRGLVFILGSTIFFGATVRGLGLVPTTAIAVFIAAYASERMRPGLAVILSIVLTLFVLAVFHYGLGLPLRVVGPWLDFLPGDR